MEAKARQASKRARKLRRALVGILPHAALLWWRRLATSGELARSRRWDRSCSLTPQAQANLPYVIWIAAFNTSFIFLYLIIHTWASSKPLARAVGAPAIFDAFNRNGLVVFLVVSLPSYACKDSRSSHSLFAGQPTHWTRQRFDREHVHLRLARHDRTAAVLCWSGRSSMGVTDKEVADVRYDGFCDATSSSRPSLPPFHAQESTPTAVSRLFVTAQE